MGSHARPRRGASGGAGGFRRDVGAGAMLWVSVGSIIGSGWLFGARNAAEIAGPAAIVSWLVGGASMALLALIHAELGGLAPVTGGSARYPQYAFGGFAALSFGWFAWLHSATIAPIEVEAMIGYARHWPWAQGLQRPDGTLTVSGFVTAVALMAVFVVVNFCGVRVLAHTNSVVTWWKVAVPLLVIVTLAASGIHAGNLSAHGLAPGGLKGILAAVSTSGVIFAYLGFEQALQIGGEARNPARDIPRAVLGSVAVAAVVYVLIQVVFVLALPPWTIAGGWDRLQFPGIDGPFAGLTTVVGLGWLTVVLYLDSIVSPAGTGLVYATSASRLSFALGRSGYAPRSLAKVNRRGVPWLGVILAFVVGVLCFVPFPSWQQMVGFITSASVLMYAGAPLAFGALRRRLPDRERPYRLAAGGFFAPLSFAVANLIIYWSGWATVWRLGVAVIVGCAGLGVHALIGVRRGTSRISSLDLRASQWLPAYLLGMGLLSYEGSFGAGSRAAIPVGWDMGLITIFSLVIYYWACAVALPSQVIERMLHEPDNTRQRETGEKP